MQILAVTTHEHVFNKYEIVCFLYTYFNFSKNLSVSTFHHCPEFNPGMKYFSSNFEFLECFLNNMLS